MLQCCVCVSSVCDVCIVAKLCKSYYWQPIGSRIWEIDWYQNEWPWPLFRGRLRSCQALRHIRQWISRKPLEIEVWFPRTTNRKWPMGYQMVTWSMTSCDPERSNSWPQIRLERNIPKTAGDMLFSNNHTVNVSSIYDVLFSPAMTPRCLSLLPMWTTVCLLVFGAILHHVLDKRLPLSTSEIFDLLSNH